MAICDICRQEMTRAIPCTLTAYEVAGVWYPRIPSDHEVHPCHDCGTPPGQLHHPGCDNERCPVCGDQLISCDCV